MGDVNPIHTLGDYSKPSHKGYKNVVPLRSDTTWLVQNGCSFHGLRYEDPNQHLKDFLKLVDSLDLDGSITTWEDLATRFLARFFPPGRTAKLRNDILMFQQHQGQSLSEAWTHFKDILQKVPHHGIDRWLQIQIFYDHVSFHLKCEIDRAAGGKIRNKNPDESWEIIKNHALYDHEGWNDAKKIVKPVKAISTPQPTSKMLDRRLLELEDQISFLLKGSRLTPRPSSTHVPQAYAKAVYLNPCLRNQNEPPKQGPFTFRERTDPIP
ncbi:zinc finger, CCHC-type containing protein [Tanacetum coccineum]